MSVVALIVRGRILQGLLSVVEVPCGGRMLLVVVAKLSLLLSLAAGSSHELAKLCLRQDGISVRI